jgi:hypothetical protein
VDRILVDHHQMMGFVTAIANVTSVARMYGFHVGRPIFARHKIDLTKFTTIVVVFAAMHAQHVLVQLEFVEEGFLAMTVGALTEEVLGRLVQFHVAHIVAVAVDEKNVKFVVCVGYWELTLP